MFTDHVQVYHFEARCSIMHTILHRCTQTIESVGSTAVFVFDVAEGKMYD